MTIDGSPAPFQRAAMGTVRIWLSGLLAVGFWLLSVYGSGPSPLPADAPAPAFSAARADAILARLLGPQVPHPNGSLAAAAFRALCNMLNRRCHLAFFQMDRDKIGRYQGILATLLREHQPALAQHLADLDIESDLFLYDWFFTVFSRALPLELAVRIWDLYFLVGDVRRCARTSPCARAPPPC